MANKDKYYPIEKILDKRIRSGKVRINNNRYKRHRFHYLNLVQVQYLIKWMGYSSKSNSWEPKSSIIKIQPKVCPKTISCVRK